jgi:hypothetical protein
MVQINELIFFDRQTSPFWIGAPNMYVLTNQLDYGDLFDQYI